ncbi:uncharacterized protein LOC144702949 [Wolffia australiana]
MDARLQSLEEKFDRLLLALEQRPDHRMPRQEPELPISGPLLPTQGQEHTAPLPREPPPVQPPPPSGPPPPPNEGERAGAARADDLSANPTGPGAGYADRSSGPAFDPWADPSLSRRERARLKQIGPLKGGGQTGPLMTGPGGPRDLSADDFRQLATAGVGCSKDVREFPPPDVGWEYRRVSAEESHGLSWRPHSPRTRLTLQECGLGPEGANGFRRGHSREPPPPREPRPGPRLPPVMPRHDQGPFVGESESDHDEEEEYNCRGPARRGHRPDNRQYQSSHHHRTADIPSFTGGDPERWLRHVEHYFRAYPARDAERLRIVSSYMEGKLGRLQTATVISFRLATTGGLPSTVQVASKGHGDEVVSTFVDLIGYLPKISEETAMHALYSALKPSLQAEIDRREPRSTEALIDCAFKAEKLLQQLEMTASRRSSVIQRAAGDNSRSFTAPNSLGGVQGGNLPTRVPRQIRLTAEEIASGRRKDYESTGILSDGEVEVEDEPSPMTDSPRNLRKLTTQAVTNMSAPHSLQLKGRIHDREVTILIDSGASDNFIDDGLARRLGLRRQRTTPYCVRYGDSRQSHGAELWPNVSLHIQAYSAVVSFHPVQDLCLDVILGFAWLRTLGWTSTQWDLLLLRFQADRVWHTLKGDPSEMQLEAAVNSKSSKRAATIGMGLYKLAITSSVISQETGSQADSEPYKAQFPTVFQAPTTLPPHRACDHQITLRPGEGPIHCRPYRYSHLQKNELERLVEEQLTAGIIRPSRSPFSSPALLVKKKTGGWRFCVDYRALNGITVPDRFPIPVVDELLEELHGTTIFSKLDLKSGYHQIRMKPEDVEKTAFCTHQGRYEYLVMPFGLCNAPATFQALMNEIFRPFLRKFVLVFFDDILIYSRNRSEHKAHLRAVLQVMMEHRLSVNATKCSFAQSRLEYLGHWISAKGVATDAAKIEAIREWPRPQTLRQLCGFLGLAGYYRRFIQGYASKAWPLTQLLKKGNFQWGEEAQEAFKGLKQALSTAPVLALPDFAQPLTIDTDASGVGVGAVLLQKEQPIAFFSKALPPTIHTRSAYERELVAVVLAVKKWRHYLMFCPFIIRTDQRSLKHLLEQREIQDRDFEPSGRRIISPNDDPDATVCAVSLSPWGDMGSLHQEVDSDPYLRAIIQKLQKDPNGQGKYKLSHGALFHDGCLVLPAGSPKIGLILKELHDGVIGVIGVSSRLLRFKTLSLSPAGLLQPLPIPQQIWEDISMDFVEGLPKSGRVDCIFVVVDRLSKYAHFIGLGHPFTAKDVASKFTTEIVKLHGTPRTIISDRGSIFLSHFWTELHKLQGTKLHHSSAYHPETDGDQPKKWSSWLHWAELSYNTSYHAAIKMSPFKAVYGREPPTLLRHGSPATPLDDLDHLLLERDQMLTLLRQHLSRAQAIMKPAADSHRRDVEFKVGELVFLQLKHYHMRSLARVPNEKLAPNSRRRRERRTGHNHCREASRQNRNGKSLPRTFQPFSPPPKDSKSSCIGPAYPTSKLLGKLRPAYATNSQIFSLRTS